MELRHLQHFVAVAEERHFTRAAQRLNIAQSALSSSIRTLEDDLQSRLFVRSTRSVALTAAGAAFLDRAQEALKVIEAGRQLVREIEGLKCGSIAIGTAHSLPTFIALPDLIARFHAAYPGIEVRLRQGETADLIDRLVHGGLDLAFVPLPEPAEAGIATRFVACEDLVAVMPRNHRLAGRSTVTLTELAGLPFVDFSAGWGTRPLVDQAFASAGAERRTVSEVTDLETLVSLVASGLGVALLPESIAAARGDDIAAVAIDAIDICWQLVVAHAGALPVNSAARAFLDLL